MQQVENLVCGGSCGGDRKIICETLIADDHDSHPKLSFSADPDFPAESFRIPREQEQDWVEHNAFLYRKPSTKQQQQQPHSQSQRISMKKTKSSIFGLPEIRNSGRWCTKSRPARIHFFPKRNFSRNRSSGSSRLPEIEPISPKVSCIGRVKLKDKKKRKKKKRAAASPAAGGKSGMWVKLTGLLGLGCRKKTVIDCVERMPENPPAEDIKIDEVDVGGRISVEESAAPPSLGALKRFTSGRKASSMGSALEFMDFEPTGAVKEETGVKDETGDLQSAPATPNVSKTPVLEAADGGGIWRRRMAAMPRSVDCVRDWGKVGPVSV